MDWGLHSGEMWLVDFRAGTRPAVFHKMSVG